MIKPFCAASNMFSGNAFMPFSIGANTCKHALTVSHASNKHSLSSCISLLYASGKPLSVVSIAVKSPYTRPVFPRISSAISGFFFCGIIDEPVVKSLDSSINLNSQLDQSISSSLSLDKCIISIEHADIKSTVKSLSETPSKLFLQTSPKAS